MKKLPVFLSMALFLSLLLGACSTNNQGANQGKTQSTARPQATAAAKATAAVNPTTAPQATAAANATPTAIAANAEEANLYLASQLLGYELQDKAGEDLGKINSMVVERQTGQIAYLFLDPKSDLKVNGDLLAIPWSAVKVNQQANQENGKGETMVYNLSRETLVSSPAFKDDDKLVVSAANWDKDLRGYWGKEVAVLPNTGAIANGQSDMARIQKVDDIHLNDASGKDIGEVKDMVLDPATGKISYILWGAGGFLGIGEDLVPVPLSRLTWNVDQKDKSTLVFNVDQAALKAAPHYSSVKDLGDLTKPGWDQKIRDFWAGLK